MTSALRARVSVPPPIRIPPPRKQDPSPGVYGQPGTNTAESTIKNKPQTASGYAFGGVWLSGIEWVLLAGVVVLAVAVRLHHISWPASVVFDEVHFGKFASKYIQRRYYVDVHPPLAKLLITLTAYIGGYDGSFDFKEIGKNYPRRVPYTLMRSLPALLGVGVVPLTYLTLRGLRCRSSTAFLGSLFITFENGLITQSRFILLDSPLVFFTALTTLSWVGFSNEEHQRPFTKSWWLWLSFTGLSLGAVASCKWVGLLTFATIGIATLKQLWDQRRHSLRLRIKHFLARVACLIVLPLLVYMTCFQIHFWILTQSGEGDSSMSPRFQSTLRGNEMNDTFADVALGSEVSIRHLGTQGGGFLNSHDRYYPSGSQQQQVSLRPSRHPDNIWRIVHSDAEGRPQPTNEIEYLADGAKIRLEHVATSRRLHYHNVRPPISQDDFHNEVSAYGDPGFEGDENDDWVMEIDSGGEGGQVKAIDAVFRLRHAVEGCYLYSHRVNLPRWGLQQQEVTCNKNPADRAGSLWFIETNTHPGFPSDAPRVNYKSPSFLSKFIELQKVMWARNAAFTSTRRHPSESRPQQWLTLDKGINYWVRNNYQVYLLGNPFVWWLSTASVAAYFVGRAVLFLGGKRLGQRLNHGSVVKYDQMCSFLALGWALHFFPFFLMKRQLFLHHYFPALYFAILLTATVFDLATSRLKPKVRWLITLLFISAAIWTWNRFSALTYGGPWTYKDCRSARWSNSWDFRCETFPTKYSSYNK